MLSSFFHKIKSRGNITKATEQIIKEDKILFEKLKLQLTAIKDSFQADAQAIVQSGMQKKSSDSSTLLESWNASSLTLLIATKNYSILAASSIEFIATPEYRYLQKMFLVADLDFSKESKATQRVVALFIDTFKTFELWMQNNDVLNNLQTRNHLLVNTNTDNAALSALEARTDAFRQQCDALTTQTQQFITAIFVELTTLPRKIVLATANLLQAESALRQLTSEEECTVQSWIIESHQKEKEVLTDQFTNSIFNPLFNKYSKSLVQQGAVEFLSSELYLKVNAIMHTTDSFKASHFAKEIRPIQALLPSLHACLRQLETLRNDSLFLETYADLREESYQPPRLSKS